MKRIFVILIAAASVFAACNGLENDGSGNIEVDSDVAAIQTIVKALESNGFVKSVKDGSDNSVSVVLRSGEKMTVRASGSSSSALGVVKGTDGTYFWALDGTPMEYAVSVTKPLLKLENGHLYVTFDNSKTWELAGEESDDGTISLFKSCEYDGDNVTFELGDGSELVLPRTCPLRMAYDVELPVAVDPNSVSELGFRIESAIKDVEVKITSSDDIKAELTMTGDLAGTIRIETGNIIEESTRITVNLSDGVNKVTESIKFIPAEGEVFGLITENVVLFDNAGEFSLKLYANLDYTVEEAPDWIESVGSEPGGEKREVIHVFKARQNTAVENRNGNIVLCSSNQTRLSVPVVQMGTAEASKPFFHRSVAVRYTADWCGYCPNMAAGFVDAEKMMPGHLEIISLHCEGALAFGWAAPLMSQFYVTGYPMGIIDGRMLMQNYDVDTIAEYTKKYAENTAELYSTVSGISIASSLEGRNLDINMSIYLKAADSYKITTMLDEDGIVGWQANYYTGDTNNYVHDGVPRIAFDDVTGVPFSTAAEKEIKDFSYSVSVDEKYNIDNMRVVVYVQRAFGDREKVCSRNYGEYYIDNSATVKLGQTLELQYAE